MTYCSLRFSWQTTNQCQIIIVPGDGGQRNASAPKPLFSAHFKALLYPLSTYDGLLLMQAGSRSTHSVWSEIGINKMVLKHLHPQRQVSV